MTDASLPRAIQLTSWQALIGHTILAVIEHPYGYRVCDLLIVTETMCWIAVEAPPDECGVDQYASLMQLISAGVISSTGHTQRELILDEEAIRLVRQLRADMAQIEGGGT